MSSKEDEVARLKGEIIRVKEGIYHLEKARALFSGSVAASTSLAIEVACFDLALMQGRLQDYRAREGAEMEEKEKEKAKEEEEKNKD